MSEVKVPFDLGIKWFVDVLYFIIELNTKAGHVKLTFSILMPAPRPHQHVRLYTCAVAATS